MIGNQDISDSIYIITISFSLTILSKITDNSFITLILMQKNTSSTILYIASILSSLILNILSIIIGNIICYFMGIDIIKNFFLIIVFSLYGFMSIIMACKVFSKNDEGQNKLIDKIINDSSDEDSERPNFNIKTDKNEMEIELDNFNSDGSIDDKMNLNKEKNQEGKNNDLKSNLRIFFNTFNSLILIEMGEKIQIFNISLVSKYKNWIYLILGNFFALFIINGISIFYGVKIIQKKINYISLILEGIIYLSIAFYHIYLYI